MSQVVLSAPGASPRPIIGSHTPGRRRREVFVAYLLIAPAALLVFGLLAYPFGWELWLSLTNRSVQEPVAIFIGLRNYQGLLGDPEFWRALGNTTAYIVLTSVLKMAVGVGIALALARPFPGRPLVFLAAFLPWAYPAGVTMIGWFWFLVPPVHASYAEFMSNLRLFVERPLGDGAWGFMSIVLYGIWRGGSFTGIFLLAALNGIPQELFDYAALEVRSGWRKFWMVTVPLLRPFLALAVFLSLVASVTDLGNIWLQTGRRNVYPIVWTQAMQYALVGGQWGKAAALSLILLPVIVVILVVCFRLFEPLEEDPT